jgi:hypothetical protein
MAIHHDKKAYGKLAPTSEELSPEKLQAMLAELNNEQSESETNNDVQTTVQPDNFTNPNNVKQNNYKTAKSTSHARKKIVKF